MSVYALLFEAKSIQEYLFQSGRLKECIGASELIDSLTSTGGLLDDVLRALRVEENDGIKFSRRAGGAFHVVGTDERAMATLMALWSVLIQQYAPGLAYDLGRGQGATALEALDDARSSLRADTSRHRSRLPVASPVTRRSRRTGLAVELHIHGEDLDAASIRKRRTDQHGLVDRFSPPACSIAPEHWPRVFEAEEGEPGSSRVFPFARERRTVALIHADGNSLGQVLRSIRQRGTDADNDGIGRLREFSEGIACCTRNAAREATRTVLVQARALDGMLPARPIVQGGDDLTIIVRADLALQFLDVFVRTFELHSRTFLGQLRDNGMTSLPDQLTMGAAVVYLRASQPFYMASNLSESLIEKAKRDAKSLAKRDAKSFDHSSPPSSVAFYRVTSTLLDDYEDIIESERTYCHGKEKYVDTLGTYFLGVQAQRPKLGDLLDLQRLLQSKDMARGPTRQLLTLMGLAPDQAKSRYRRWRQLMKEHKQEQLERFDAAMGKLLEEFSKELPLPYCAKTDSSPIGDALALMAVDNAPDSAPEVTIDAGVSAR